VRRILQRIDADTLDTAVGSWLAGRERGAGQAENDSCRPLPSLAVDGKTVRGARRSDATQVQLLAAMTGTGLVTAQREVDGKTNEITVFQPLLARSTCTAPWSPSTPSTRRPPKHASSSRTSTPAASH
jgi:hypothetical protein